MSRSDNGAALILVLLVLSFLAAIGSALLSSLTLDVRITANYVTGANSLYLAEAGLEDARERLRVAGMPAVVPSPFVSGDTPSGSYRVFLRNDIAGTVRLVSTGEAGNSRRTLEMTVRKAAFPEIPPLSATALNALAVSLAANAMDVLNSPAVIAGYGSPSAYRVAVVNGDCILGPGVGYGLLLVRGELILNGEFTWNGLIVVIGEGVIRRRPDVSGEVMGGLFVARTVDARPASADLDGVGIRSDAGARALANASFPYEIVSWREY